MATALEKIFQGAVVATNSYALDSPTTWQNVVDDGVFVATCRFNGVRTTGHIIPMEGYDGTGTVNGLELPYDDVQGQTLDSVDRTDGQFTFSGAPNVDTLAIYKTSLSGLVMRGDKLYSAAVNTTGSFNLDNSVTWGDVISTHGAVLLSHRFNNNITGDCMSGTFIVLENYEDGTELHCPMSHNRWSTLTNVDLADGQFNWSTIGGLTSIHNLTIHGIDVTIV